MPKCDFNKVACKEHLAKNAKEHLWRAASEYMRNYFQVTIYTSWFDLIKAKTLVTFQVLAYLGKADLILRTPLRSHMLKVIF